MAKCNQLTPLPFKGLKVTSTVCAVAEHLPACISVQIQDLVEMYVRRAVNKIGEKSVLWLRMTMNVYICELTVGQLLTTWFVKRRLTWFGHVERMEDNRIPHRALHCYIMGSRSRRRQRKTWLDNVEENLRMHRETTRRNLVQTHRQFTWWKRKKSDPFLCPLTG